MSTLLSEYAAAAGPEAIEQLRQLAAPLRGMRVVHVNSARTGGGVAEILAKLTPLLRELEIDASWEVLTGNGDFYACTKAMHNALQGQRSALSERALAAYERTNAENAGALRPSLEQADVVFVHDPQPAPLLGLCPNRTGKWIWRCHIDLSRLYRPVWRYLKRFVNGYDASVFSLAAYAQMLPHPQYLIAPSIDPLSDKNCEIPRRELQKVHHRFDLDPERPLILQVARYDRFKDPLGVIEAYRLAKRFSPALQLVLAGGPADDDPEGEAILHEVRAAAEGDGDIHVLLLPPDAHRTINALQRSADIVLQKSIREGFGLTVTEGLWKGKPVVGGDTGGIRLQVVNYQTGFLVNSPEGAALRIRYLLQHRERLREMGLKGRRLVRDNFLLTRQLREYLTLIHGLLHARSDRIELL